MISSISGGSSGFNISSTKLDQIFKSIDSNGDGKIDKSEASAFQKSRQAKGAQGGPSVDRIFNKLDANSDGAITLQEADAGMAKLAQRMHSSNGAQGTAGNHQVSQVTQSLGNLDTLLAALATADDSSASSGAPKTQPDNQSSSTSACAATNLNGAYAVALQSYGLWSTGGAQTASDSTSPASSANGQL